MKKLLVLFALIAAVAGTAAAQRSETLTIRNGQQKTAAHSRLKVRFIAVTEDSRCPTGTVCVWAGNAKVKFEVTVRGAKPQTFEVNTTVGPKGDQYAGWAVDLVSLTPVPNGSKPLDPKNYQAKFTIKRLQR